MKKEAFTLIELIFVIVIIGILSSVAINSFKPHHLRNDINFVLMKLEETRYKAIGYDKSLSSGLDYTIGCISINNLNDTHVTKTKTNAYKFHASFDMASITPNIICFDTLGKVHDGEIDQNKTTLGSLLPNDVNLTYKYNNKAGSLIIDHFSGSIRTIIQY
jgi:prepilin-type N-terminal cleavage/methylation domain-containing protein